MNEKLEFLRELIEKETIAELHRQKLTMVADTYKCQLKMGKKYARLDIGAVHNMGGRYMVDLSTGEIFGIKAYGVIHRGHRYGTLDTIKQYFWGSYTATKKKCPHNWDDINKCVQCEMNDYKTE